jgi:hypothetical protein
MAMSIDDQCGFQGVFVYELNNLFCFLLFISARVDDDGLVCIMTEHDVTVRAEHSNRERFGFHLHLQKKAASAY